MNNFVFSLPTKIVFGRGVENQIGERIKEYGATKVLLHYGGGSIKRSGLFDRVVGSLREAGLSYVELGGVQPNPRLSLVYRGIELCRGQKVDFVLAVGGGSVIDSAKAIAHGLKYDGDVWDFFAGKAQSKAVAPLAVILTIPAAGSESSNSAVITNDLAGNVKRGFSTELNRPLFSLLNPELCFTLPKEQIANGAADMMAHIIERYFTNTPHVDVSDRMSEGVMRTIVENAPKALENPTDYDTWCQLMWAGALAHNNILGVDKAQDWSSHQLGHELSGRYDIAHGASLAIVMPAWMRYVYKHNPARFAQFGNRVFDVAINPYDLEGTALKAIAAFSAFLAGMGLPTTLKQAGIDGSELEALSKKVKRTNPDGTTGSFVPLDAQACYEIYRSCLGN